MLINQEACFTILMNRKNCLTGLHNVLVIKREDEKQNIDQEY